MRAFALRMLNYAAQGVEIAGWYLILGAYWVYRWMGDNFSASRIDAQIQLGHAIEEQRGEYYDMQNRIQETISRIQSAPLN